MPRAFEVDVSRLVDAETNPNFMDPEEYAALVDGMRTRGCLQPPLVSPNSECPEHDLGEPGCSCDARSYTIIDGHHRAKAAREVGLTKLPVTVVKFDEDEAKAQRIAMNKIRGNLDLSMVGKIFVELAESGWSMSQIGITGYTEDEINSLIESAQSDDLDSFANVPPVVTSVDTEAGFSMEVEFDSAEQMAKAKRALRKVAGKGNPLGRAVMQLLGEDVN